MLDHRQSTLRVLKYGTQAIAYSLRFSNRKTLAIEVHPDLSVVVIAPAGTAIEKIEQKLLKRGRWICTRLQEFESYLPKLPTRAYVSGETHLYLGKRYLLRVLTGSEQAQVKLIGGELLVHVQTPQQVKGVLADWYFWHAKRVFRQQMDTCATLFREIDKPELHIKRMPKRWGSYLPGHRVALNPELIKASSDCIRYVIIHEMCHAIHPNHSPDFYALLAYKLPKWKEYKQKLESRFNT